MKRAALSLVLFLAAACSKADPEASPTPSPIAEPASSAAPSPAQTPAAPAKIVRPREVALAEILDAYKSNELRADGQFKGRFMQAYGVVGQVSKDIAGNAFVTIGRGEGLEIPTFQCVLAKGQEQAAAELSAGKPATVRGVVEGLMVNVIARDCVVNPVMQLCREMKDKLGAKRCSVSEKNGDAVGVAFVENDDGGLVGLLGCATERGVNSADEVYDRVTDRQKLGLATNDPTVIIGSHRSLCFGIFRSGAKDKGEEIPSGTVTKIKSLFDAYSL